VPADCEKASHVKRTCALCGETIEEAYPDDVAEPALGHKEALMEDVAPTCKDTGLSGGVYCTVCGKTLLEPTEVPIDADAHKVELSKTLKEATCTTTGIGKYVCGLCGKDMGYKTIAAQHDWQEVSRVEATCSKDGKAEYVCAVCEETKEETLKATGEHTPAEDEKVFEATCTEPERIANYCSVCGEILGQAEAVEGSKPLGHDMVLDTANENYKAATCTEGGLDTLKCSRCDVTEEKATEALGHSCNDGAHVEADCDHASGVKYTCTVCGETMVEAYPDGVGEPALGHKEALMADVAPTCKDTGLTGGVYCTVCGETLVEPTEVPVDLNAHVKKLSKTLKEATCTTTGIGKYVCELCGADMGYKTIAAQHDWQEVSRVEATCGKDGKAEYVCAACKETKEEILKATGKHTPAGEETIVEATCTEPQKIANYCSVCGEIIGEAEIVDGSEPLGHDLVLDTTNENYKAATCTEGGLDTLKCSRCDYIGAKITEALGHKWDDGDVVEAGCENAAGVKHTCTVCGETMVEEFEGELAQPALGHKPASMEEIPSTCQTKGLTGGVYCTVCGATLVQPTELPLDPNVHEYQPSDKPLREATCSVTGIVKQTCKCGKTTYATIEKLPHEMGEDGVVTKDATCTEPGTLTFTCTVCGETVEETIAPIGHAWSEEKTSDDSTIVYRECAVCGEIEVLENLNGDGTCTHNATKTEIVTEPTCTDAGVKKVVCLFCGEILEEEAEIPALGHTEEVIPAKEATCAEAGLTEGKKCSVCGKTLVAQEKIPALNHTEEVIPAKEATCAEAGLTEGKKCSVCGEILTAQEEIPALNHTEEVIPAKEATCAEAGLTEGKKCSVCGEILAAQEEIPALSHTEEVLPAVEPTCTETGLTEGKKCTVCGEILAAQEEIPALGHKEEVVPGKAATCTEDGLTDGKVCSRCDAILAEQEVIPAAHTEQIVPGKAATCTEDGLTDGKVCAVCGAILVEQEVIPAAHTEEVVPGKAATCIEDGLTDGKVCAVCGAILVEQEVIPAAHTEEVIPGKAATCTEDGLTEGKKCSVCDEILTAQKDIPAIGHHYVYKDSYLDDNGKAYVEKECEYCKDIITVTAPNP